MTTTATPNPRVLPSALSAAAIFQEWLDVPQSQSLALLRSLDPEPHIQSYWTRKTRPDGRLFAQGRPTKVVESILKHSAGSALVQQGGSKVLAAMTLQIGQPSPEFPEEGEVTVQLSGSGGRSGPDARQFPRHWDVLQSWLQRVLEQDGIPSQLNLLTGKACIRLVTTVLILEDGGNLKDVALLACMGAWKDTRLPVMGRDLKEVQGKLWWKHGGPITSLEAEQTELPMETQDFVPSPNKQYRISLSMGVWVHPEKATHFLVDPSLEEEEFLDGNLTVVVRLATGKLQVEYTGKVALTATDLAFAAKLAKGQAEELAKILS